MKLLLTACLLAVSYAQTGIDESCGNLEITCNPGSLYDGVYQQSSTSMNQHIRFDATTSNAVLYWEGSWIISNDGSDLWLISSEDTPIPSSGVWHLVDVNADTEQLSCEIQISLCKNLTPSFSPSFLPSFEPIEGTGTWGASDMPMEEVEALWDNVLYGHTNEGLVTMSELESLGQPVSMDQQVVEGMSYRFTFSNGAEVIVLEQDWLDILEITSYTPGSAPVLPCVDDDAGIQALAASGGLSVTSCADVAASCPKYPQIRELCPMTCKVERCLNYCSFFADDPVGFELLFPGSTCASTFHFCWAPQLNQVCRRTCCERGSSTI